MIPAPATDPFPHLIGEGLFPDQLLDAVAAEFPHPDDGRWRRYGNGNEVKYEGPAEMWGQATGRYFAVLAAQADELGAAFGIEGLSLETVGGGYHLVPPGAGRLAIHTDFNRSPATGLYRRLNVLTYLNRGWADEGGRLELWPDGAGEPTVIPPEFGRTVAFETSDRSWHGHPTPACRWRLSVAAYGFSPDPPPGYTGDHSTVWR